MNDDPEINELIFLVNLMKSKANGTASDLQVGDLVRTRITDGFRKGTDPRYSGHIHTVMKINGNKCLHVECLLIPVRRRSKTTFKKHVFVRVYLY